MGIQQSSILVGGGGGGPPSLHVTFLTLEAASGTAAGAAACGNVASVGPPNTNVTGGTGPYSFMWTRVSSQHSGATYGITGSTLQNPTWAATVCAVSMGSETWRVDVHDPVTGRTGFASFLVALTWVDTR